MGDMGDGIEKWIVNGLKDWQCNFYTSLFIELFLNRVLNEINIHSIGRVLSKIFL